MTSATVSVITFTTLSFSSHSISSARRNSPSSKQHERSHS